MKTKLTILLSILIFTAVGCKKTDTPQADSPLEISQSVLNNIAAIASQVSVDVTCSASWSVQSDAQWCRPKTLQGSGNQTLKIDIDANATEASRQATVTITSGDTQKKLQITQLPQNVNILEDYVYQMPVIFHTIYNDKNNANQYVTAARVAEILAAVNKSYQQLQNGNNIKVEFVLATTDPKGAKLSEAGIERIFQPEAAIDCDIFMNDESGKYKPLIWDPNKYINVMLYTFKGEAGSQYVTLGVSHLPFSPKSNYLEGLSKVDYDYLGLNQIKFPYSISINNEYINSKGDSSNAERTLTHELGHYLGLHHVFAEGADGNTNLCMDSDYCKDTETYNIQTYNKKFEVEFKPGDTFEKWAKRNNCKGVEFVSRNIMDYWVGYLDTFSPEQRGRIRHVLAYSPLIPGPKLTFKSMSSKADGVLDLPIVTRR